MNRPNLTWGLPSPETSNASAAVRKLALPLQRSFAADSGLGRTWQTPTVISGFDRCCLKSLFEATNEIFKAAGAFLAQRREGPHRVSEKRPRTFVSALQRVAAAE